VAPALLVPAAWTATGAVHADVMSEDGLFIAHFVMAGFIAVFAVSGWRSMSTGALRTWRTVLVVGLGLTLAGIGGFVTATDTLQAISIVGWMLLPAAGLADTGRRLADGAGLYYAGAAVAVLGGLIYLGAVGAVDGGLPLELIGIATVGIGQTAGILEASLRSQ
jgi:hypothetical protein